MNNIVIISGGTGVGTSTYSFELAKLLNIHTIISTDTIREITRSLIHPSINETLSKSTYSAGKTVNYYDKSADVKREQIIRGFKFQCSPIQTGIESIISRANDENNDIIVEGVHILPGKINDNNYHNITQFHLFISDEKTHRERFLQREIEAPNRKVSKYLENFDEIRLIHDYLGERAKRYNEIVKINNDESLQNGLQIILKKIYAK